MSGAWIKIGFFLTDDDLRYQDEIHGNLFEQVEKTLDLLSTKYLKAYISYHGLQRRETFLFPQAALREALLNAVVHKDYSSSIPIQISAYDDQIVLWNPGDLPENWTLAKLLGKHPSCPFNPLLANAFFRAGYIESWGRGIQKIQRECREHGIEPPVYDFEMAGLLLTFRANPAHVKASIEQGETAQEVQGTAQETAQEIQKTAQETASTTPIIAQETQEKVLALLRSTPPITRRKLASELGLSDSGVKYHLERMKAAGIIRRVGATKSGYWEVMK